MTSAQGVLGGPMTHRPRSTPDDAPSSGPTLGSGSPIIPGPSAAAGSPSGGERDKGPGPPPHAGGATPVHRPGARSLRWVREEAYCGRLPSPPEGPARRFIGGSYFWNF